MLSIVAHHFVVNSGLFNGPMQDDPHSWNSIYLSLFGMWGKTGINCFMMITGYFMCKSEISLRKFFKLLAWIYTYHIILYPILLLAGYETLSVSRIVKVCMPVWGFNSNFTSCFLGFWLTIPFWNILTRNMSRKQHLSLTTLMLLFYTILGSVPKFHISFNYITWFGIIYLIASYIRLYPHSIFENKRFWMIASIASILIAMASVFAFNFFFVYDSNKIFAVAVAVSTFLWFKNINLRYSKIINIIGGTTFGVLLIHANSDAMRQWLWKDTVDCVGHYSLPLSQLILFSVGTVLAIFFICSAIDRVRQLLIEEPFFKWYDKKNISQRITEKFNAFPLIQKLNQNNE
jgi:hypothetical protein